MSSRRANLLLSVIVLLSLVIQPLGAVAAVPAGAAPGNAADPGTHPDPGFLFRATVTLDSVRNLARLEKTGVLVLRALDGEQAALVLADGDQLADLARLGFRPQAADELRGLLNAQGPARRWLAQGLEPLLAQADAVAEQRAIVEQQALAGGASAAAAPDAAAEAAALQTLRTSMQVLTPEQIAGVAGSASVDDDADGLTNTQEAWWCTDPLDTDTDDDGRTDGAEILALENWIANRSANAPGETPWPSWPFNTTTCPDKDHDSIPNLAERWALGLNMDWESSDRDKFDDGQELFGVTYCPGGDLSCNYGDLPRSSDSGYVGATMPSWVKAPGKHPLVAAYPVPEIAVVESSLHVQTVTTVTTDHIITSGTEESYSTAKTDGASTSQSKTVMWNDWQENSESWQEHATNASITASEMKVNGDSFFDTLKRKLVNGVNYIRAQAIAESGCLTANLGFSYVVQAGLEYDNLYTNAKCRGALRQARAISPDWATRFPDEQNLYSPSETRVDGIDRINLLNQIVLNNTIDVDSILGGLEGVQYATTQAGELLGQRIYEVAYALAAPKKTETNTKGSSWGGAQTTTTTQYEEHTITNGEAFSSEESWGTATAVDSAHSADLWFTYRVRNTGTEYAREIADLAFNVYVGDDSNPVYTYFVGPDLGGDGKFHNFMPGEEHTYTARHIPLTLEQMRDVDLGGPIRVVVEDFTYGADELFYEDAANAGVLFAMEDGTDDGDEAIDTYLIPTWGAETVLDVLARYFRCPSGQTCTDADGNLMAIWTPEYRADTPAWCVEPQVVGTGSQRTLWCKHTLSTTDWWNIYTDGMGDGSEGFQDTPASPGQVALFRFNKDSDLDGYSDRSEARLGTDPNDPASFPRPELLAGVHSIRTGNNVVATLSLLNTGVYDAYGVEAVMIAPNDTISITNNTVGGSGRVRAQRQVIVGSRINPQSPLPTAWLAAGHAQPATGGYYTGPADRTYTFTVQSCGAGGCDVGAGTWTLGWNDGAGASGSLNFGAGYASPTLLPVGAFGLKLGQLTGHVNNGESFTVAANTPRDTFQYTIAAGHENDFTPPIVIVSYNDPQGNHRFVIPPTAMNLPSPAADLLAFSGQMLQNPGLEIVTGSAFAAGTNTTDLVVSNPTETTLTGAHLFLEFIDPEGAVVLEVPATATLPAGPNVVPVAWDSGSFDPPYDPAQDYIVMAFWTDYQGNILDTAARPLSSFQEDPKPAFAIAAADETWDFGTAVRGTILKRSFTFANTGFGDLQTYASAPAGLTVSQTGSRRVGPADMTTYEMTLNTANVTMSAYNETVTIRTSDPDVPTRTVHVLGTITAGAADTQPGAVVRPLDWPATVSGNQGDWVEFTHTLGPEPQTLHPVKVYSQDYGVLKGVGRYATPFGAGTASYDMFGDGRDGVMPSSGNLDNNNGVGVGVVNSGSAGSYTVNVADAYGVSRINPGDAVLIHQAQGAGAGCWEINKAVSDFGGGTATYQLAKPLQCNYASGGNNHAQIQRVPQYTDCPVSGTVTPLSAWNGTWGGIFAVMCNRTMNLTGSINGAGRGFTGGVTSSSAHAEQGDSATGNGINATSANGTGGGGGALGDGAAAGGGGGGGLGSQGTAGQPGARGGGAGGITGGSADLTTLIFGGAGGGGGWRRDTAGGAGGTSGGIILLATKTLTLGGSSSIISAGNSGSANSGAGDSAGGGGGGAGGSILLRMGTGTLGTALITAAGGNGGAGKPGSDNNGGAGGVGRIRVEYCETITGSTSPAASTQKLNCYLAEQVESSPYTTTRLNLPETGTHTYQVQYGRKLNYTGAAALLPTLRVPAGMFSSVTVQALVSDLASNAFLNIDVGNTGTSSWSGTVSNNSENTSLNLAPYFNAYWASHGAPTTGYLDVPVSVYLDRAGQVLLTNLKVTLTGSKLRHIRLPVQPQGYSNVTASVTVSGGSGLLAVGVDVGANGSVDWTYNGSPAYPASLTTGNLAAAVNTYLAGGSGEVDVPIRFYLAPFATLDLTGFSAAPIGQPDALISASDVSFGATNPVEGDEVSVSATLHNTGSLDTGRLTASFYATSADWGEWYIGSTFVPNVPAGGAAQAEIVWNTLGFTGATPVRVVLDPYNRLAETNETNNEATASLTIKTRPDLRVMQIALSDNEPTAGETVTVTLTLRNDGQTAASASALALYDGNPDAGGTLVAEGSPSVAPATETNVSFAWTPAAPGSHRLFARADRARQIGEYDEGNNDAWRDVFIGFASPLLIDSGGGTAYDPAYDPALGFGYLNGESNIFCGAGSNGSQRNNWSGQVQYRFDHLLPGHFYHLDLTLYECDGLGRQERVRIDDNVISDPIDLSDLAPHRLSFRLDPAFYADRSIVISIEELLGNDAVVSEVNLYDIDYRYADAGGSTEADYSAARTFGPLDGVKQTTWGTLPYQSRRIDIGNSNPDDDPDNELRYRFDGLQPSKHYQLLITVYQGSGTAMVQQTVAVDSVDTGVMLEVTGIDRDDKVVDVPVGMYSGDGSIVVRITRLNVLAGAFVNEIALEELTLLPEQVTQVTQSLDLHSGSPNWFSFNVKPPVRPAAACTGVTATSAFTSVYGDAILGSAAAPVGTLVEAYSPAGVKTGCFKVTAEGLYGYMRVYGAEGATPGLNPGDPIIFKINGIAASPTPYPVIWQNDKAIRPVDLAAADVIPVETLLAPLAGAYTKLQCENGTYLPPPADPRFNTCTTVAPGQSYLLWTTAASALSVTGARVTADQPISLHAGYNWLGYLPTCELPVATALAGIAGKHDLLHSEAGTYRPPPANPAYNNFNTMAPGRGYMIHMTEAATLTYPAAGCGTALQVGEETAAPAFTCPATATSQFTHFYGHVMPAEDAPLGATILAYSPRGEVVGCGQVGEGGLYPYLRVYGAEDGQPGMQPGEIVRFTVDNLPATTSAEATWQNDWNVHLLDLTPGGSRYYLPIILR